MEAQTCFPVKHYNLLSGSFRSCKAEHIESRHERFTQRAKTDMNHRPIVKGVGELHGLLAFKLEPFCGTGGLQPYPVLFKKPRGN